MYSGRHGRVPMRVLLLVQVAWLLSAVGAQFTTLEAINYATTDAEACSTTSPFVGQNVTTRGFVSAVRSNGFYMQSAESSVVWGGIWVYFSLQRRTEAALSLRAAGDYVEVVATVAEYNQLTELADPFSVNLISTGHTLTPVSVTTGALGTTCTIVGEQYEGLLVTVTNAVIVSDANQYGEIQIDDGSGVTQLEDGLLNTDGHLTWLVGGALFNTTLTSVTGVVSFAYGSFELHPRDVYDIYLAGYDANATAPLRTLFEIQFVPASADACASSTMVGQMVTARGYISAVGTQGFYMQHATGGSLWGGIWVFFSSGRGDR